MRTALLIYLAGVLIGLWKVDAPGVRRVALAMAWPLGVVAAVERRVGQQKLRRAAFDDRPQQIG